MFTPSVCKLPLYEDDNTRKQKKVLVVGGGCAGLAAAWHLNRSGCDVEMYEVLDRVGGHANTINGTPEMSLLFET
jgi:predicted NAD/FAD-binding protein